MRYRMRYGRAVWTGDENHSWRPARVVDALLAMRAPARAPSGSFIATSAKHLADTYAPFLPGRLNKAGEYVLSADADANVNQLRATGAAAREEFQESAAIAREGRLSAALAVHAARVRHLPGGEMEAPDLVAFAAWCFQHLLQRGPVLIESCSVCKRPWISDGGFYCDRPVPGSAVAEGEDELADTRVEHPVENVTVFAPLRTCREYAAQSTFYKRHGDYHRQRKSLYERMRRGTLPKSEYEAWLSQNRPGQHGETWATFNEWKGGGS